METTSNTLPARLYGPALPPGGVSARLAWDGTTLRVAWSEARADVALTEVSVAQGGFNDAALALRWRDAAGAWEAQLDGTARAALLADPPVAWEEALSAVRRRTRSSARRLVWGWAAIGGVLGFPLIVLALFLWQADAVVRWVAQRIPVEQEIRLGEALWGQLAPTLKAVPEGEAAGVVRELGQRLSQGSAYPYRFHLVRDAQVNAFALPGGVIVVHSGLLAAAEKPEELAGVLAHEISHVELRHSLRNVVHSLGLRALAAFALGDWAGEAAGVAARLGELAYSRDMESEADVAGFHRLQRAGIDGRGMVTFFARLAERDGGRIALVSTHPPSAERQAALQRLHTGAALPPLPYAWPPRDLPVH